MVSHVHNLWINSRFRSRLQIRRERWEATVFAGYKVGEEIVDIGGVAVLRFSRRIKFVKICIRVSPESGEQHVVVRSSTGNATRLKWPCRTSFTVCIMNGKVSKKNLFIDGVSHKRKILCAQTGVFVDSAEIRCTGIKFIFNTFRSRCNGCGVVQM